MDESWRFRPIADHHKLCPVCSIPHYPFCRPPSALAGDNVRFRPSDFCPPLFHRPFHNPSFSSEPAFLRPPSQQFPVIHEEIVDRESFPKRMRVDDTAIGVFPSSRPSNRVLSVDDERRLNLIRDHGREGSTQVQDDRQWNNNNNIDNRMDRDRFNALQKHHSGGRADHGFLESEFYHRDDRYEAVGYEERCQNQPVSNLDREGRRDFDRMDIGSNRRGVLDSQIEGNYSYGHSDQIDRNSQVYQFRGSDEALGSSQNFVSDVSGDTCSKESRRPSSYTTNNNNISRVGSFNDQLQPSYSANDYNTLRVGKFHDLQLTHPMLNSLSFLPKQPSHSLTDSYLTPSYYHGHATQNLMESKPEFYEEKGAVIGNYFDYLHPITDENKEPYDLQTFPAAKQLNPHISKPTDYAPVTSDVNHAMGTFMPEHGHTYQAYSPIPPQPFFPVASHVMGTSVQDYEHASQPHPPIPPKPLFPIQTEPSSSSLQVTSSATTNISAVSPVGTITTTRRQIPVYGSKSLLQGEFYNEPPMQASNVLAIKGSTFIHQPSLSAVEREPSIQVKPSFKEKPVYCDAALLFKQPHRTSRPDRIVIILRGLPGSGKSYLAKAIRDIEVENGGSAPRIHAMDDYFMIEVEKKVKDNEGFKFSGSARSKKINKKVIEYCYEPEMEEAYRSSMLKAFKKTLDDGVFTFVIVDDRNLRVADFAQFWAIAKRSGFEVYLLEATYKDPTGCAARNIHGFKLADIQKMSEQWEEASPLYLHLDTQSLFGGDDMIDNSIQEVDMEADDTVGDGEHLQETEDCDSNELISSLYQESNYGSTKLGRRWDAEEEEDDDGKASSVPPKNELPKKPKSTVADAAGALSGLIQAYGKCIKYVRWGDKIETTGFSIGSIRSRQCESSLIIGPGPGYDLKSNPLPEEDSSAAAADRGGRAGSQEETKRRFDEQLRAERESFRAVFDRRKQRLAGMHFLRPDDD